MFINFMAFEKFTVSQAAAIFKEDKILILRCSRREKWLFPGGRMDKGEADRNEEAGLFVCFVARANTN